MPNIRILWLARVSQPCSLTNLFTEHNRCLQDCSRIFMLLCLILVFSSELRPATADGGPYSTNYVSSGVCDRTFFSKALNATHGATNGTFEGPVFSAQDLVPNGTILTNHARQCTYKFIAGPNERVNLSFTKFSLRSNAPECINEYMDIYYELMDPDGDLLNTPFGGRYCDQTIPHDRVSLYQTLVISFYTDLNTTHGPDIFQGLYSFINATPYIAGTLMPNQICSFAIYSDQRREGQFMSPTYPGVYPKDLNCFYLFSGLKGQRVKLEFMDFDLYYGGPHCPFDFVKIFDGDSDQAPLINVYCGQQRQLFVFSSGTTLFVQFTTLRRISDSQNRGFSGYFEFSEKFVNLGFIVNNENSEHILGSECDQKILSRKESNGTIYAPNYPFLYHPNIICKYFIYGLQDAQNLERINFHFEMLQIPTMDANECNDAYIRLYTQTEAMEEFDYVFCGETIPPPVVSEGPILLVVFNSGHTQGQGFKAHYWFETDYKITGTQASPGQCHFSYVSSNEKQGDFNSPRHPSNYPSHTHCVYEFFGDTDEQVKLVFNHFRFSDSEVEALGVTGYNQYCSRDWVEIYGIDQSGREMLYGRYCSMTTPGPIITEQGFNQMKVVMKTDASEVSSGFLANYQFIRPSEVAHNCGGNFTNLENGIITTPNYPNKYPATLQICNWFISVKPGNKVLLQFVKFNVEGNQLERGCSGAVIRVRHSDRPVELCGFRLDNISKEFISDSNELRVTFITARKSVGAEGFMATWTELKIFDAIDSVRKTVPFNSSLHHSHCHASDSFGSGTNLLSPTNTPNSIRKVPMYFQCERTGYCISSKLRCNGVLNCGFGDTSDEANCIQEARINLLELLGGLAGLSMFVFFTIGVICLTAILIGSWLRRSANEEKSAVSSFQDKNCQMHFQSNALSHEFSPYYQPDMNTMNTGTPHRVIEVMTVSSTSTNTGQAKGKWAPMVSNSLESHHHTSDNEHGFMELDSIPTSGSPIPPPPPPPSTSTRNLLSSPRQSALGNFYSGEHFIEPGTSSGNLAQGTCSTNYGFRTSSRVGVASTLNRSQPPYASNESRASTSTFGYPQTYHTLSGGNSTTLYNNRYNVPQVTCDTLQRNSRGKSSPSICKEDSNGAMLDHNEATHNGISLGAVGDDEDTDISMQLARHGDMVMAMSDDSENGRQQHRHHDDGTLALECTIGDVGLNNDSIDNGQNFDVDEQDNEDDFTEPTSLQKYQMNKMGTLVGADGRKSPAGSRWHPGAYCANDAILLDDTI